MKTFTISRKLWHRGKRKHPSALLVPQTGKMCCLGQIALQLGFSKDEIRNKPSPAALENREAFEKLNLVLLEVACSTGIGGSMMEINDEADLPDPEREAELRRLARKGGFKLRFTK